MRQLYLTLSRMIWTSMYFLEKKLLTVPGKWDRQLQISKATQCIFNERFNN